MGEAGAIPTEDASHGAEGAEVSHSGAAAGEYMSVGTDAPESDGGFFRSALSSAE